MATRLRNSVAALLALDLLVGAWMYLHAPALLPKLSLANFAVFGISGVLRLLPDADRDALVKKPLEFARSQLSKDGAARTLAILAVIVLVVAAFTSSVHVHSTGGATAEIRVVEGMESDADSAAIAAADTLALAQSGSTIADQRTICPLGQSVWAYTPTHVSRGDQVALPWKPVRWAYPDDFDEQVTLFVLPTTTAVMTLTNLRPEFVLSDIAGREIARRLVTSDGARIQFSDREPNFAQLAAAWTAEYRAQLVPANSFGLQADSVLVIGMLAPNDTLRRAEALRRHDAAVGRLRLIAGRDSAWRQAPRIRPTRPLHRGEKVRYAFDHAGTKTGPFEIVLDRNPYVLLIDSTAVDKPTLAGPP
jgi:hypothetical protein